MSCPTYPGEMASSRAISYLLTGVPWGREARRTMILEAYLPLVEIDIMFRPSQ